MPSEPRRISLLQGDITKIQVDAIVNAANSSLLGGGGVDGAIHRAAGPELVHACRLLGGCKTGQAKLTPGFRLPAPWIIHTVGPVYRDGMQGEAQQLAACYRVCLSIAAERNFQSLAFPAISCGIYGYPILEACSIAIREISQFLATNASPATVVLVAFDSQVHQAFSQILQDLD